VAIEARALARCAARDWKSPAETNEPHWEKSERSKQLAWKEARPTRHCEQRNRIHGDGVHLGKAAARRSPHPAARRSFRKRRLLPAQRRLRPRSWSARAQGKRRAPQKCARTDLSAGRLDPPPPLGFQARNLSFNPGRGQARRRKTAVRRSDASIFDARQSEVLMQDKANARRRFALGSNRSRLIRFGRTPEQLSPSIWDLLLELAFQLCRHCAGARNLRSALGSHMMFRPADSPSRRRDHRSIGRRVMRRVNGKAHAGGEIMPGAGVDAPRGRRPGDRS
jgi:hypothetical protein